jgi:hypothetical protein
MHFAMGVGPNAICPDADLERATRGAIALHLSPARRVYCGCAGTHRASTSESPWMKAFAAGPLTLAASSEREPAGEGCAMQTKTLAIGEAVRFGWDTMKSHFLFFIGLLVVVFIVVGVPNGIAGVAQAQNSTAIALAFNLIGFVLNLIVGLGIIRITLKFADGQPTEFGDLFSATSFFFSYLIASILFGLMVSIGLILLVVPGIILGVIFYFYQYAIVDRGLGPIESLQRSSELTRGVRWDLFLFMLLLFGINLLGGLALGIGLLVTIPTTTVALAHAYRQLDRQTTAALAPAPAPAPELPA